jgi:hypothetical protein
MIYHLSIAAIQPRRVADVLAELWKGEVFPFPAVAKGSFAVLAGDDRNSLIEVYPVGTELVLESGSTDAGSCHNPEASGRSATHAAISSPLPASDVLAIAEREGWTARYCKRGGHFGVLELWLENLTMVEVLTENMVSEYLATMKIEYWRAAVRDGRLS